MSRRLPVPPPGFDECPLDEKLEYLHSLWERITADEGQIPVPEWHRDLLRERLRERETIPGGTHDWEHVKSEVRRGLRGKASNR